MVVDVADDVDVVGGGAAEGGSDAAAGADEEPVDDGVGGPEAVASGTGSAVVALLATLSAEDGPSSLMTGSDDDIVVAGLGFKEGDGGGFMEGEDTGGFVGSAVWTWGEAGAFDPEAVGSAAVFDTGAEGIICGCFLEGPDGSNGNGTTAADAAVALLVDDEGDECDLSAWTCNCCLCTLVSVGKCSILSMAVSS